MKKEIREQAKKIAARFGKTYDQRQDIEGRCLEAVWKAQSKIDKDRNPHVYTDVIMKNAALSYLRQEKKVKVGSLEGITPVVNTEDEMIDQIILKQDLPNFIEKLDFPDKEIVSMLIEGASLKEIADKLDTTSNAIAVRIHRNKDTWMKYYEKSKGIRSPNSGQSSTD